jgi:hypothetical protein
MSELERSLAALAGEIEWPETPEVELRLEVAPGPARRSRRRWLVVAVAVALIAIGIAFAVPPARSAILDFFRLGGVTVERVTTLPAAEERPLAADLGAPITPEAAELVLGAPVELPHSDGEPVLHQRDGFVSAILATPEPLLFTVFRSEFDSAVVKKLSMSSLVEQARIDDQTEGLWIAGDQHLISVPEAPPRLAGNVLLWVRDGLTYRLEGRKLTKERALELARQVGD